MPGAFTGIVALAVVLHGMPAGYWTWFSTALKNPEQTQAANRIVPGRGRVFRGVVVNTRGELVEGARISITRNSLPGQEAISDSAGSFSIPGVEPGRYQLRIQAADYAALEQAVVVAEGKGPQDAGSLVLQPGFEVAGHVTDAGGNGVEGAEIFLSREPTARITSLSGKPTLPLAARTSTDGAFVLKNLREGELVLMEIWHPDYVPQSLGPVRLSRDWTPDASLTPASRLAGVVVDDESGEPIADAWLQLNYLDQEALASNPMHMTETDKAGRWAFHGLPPGRVLLVASSPGTAVYERQIHVEPAKIRDDLEIVLPAGAVVWGLVRSVNGEPVVGAKIAPAGQAQSSAFSPQDITDSEGRYRLEGIGSGPVTMVATHPRFQKADMPLEIVAASQRLDFQLQPLDLVELSGFIRDDAGTPVTNTGIGVLPTGGGILRQAISDNAGFYRIADIPNGDYRISVQSREFGVLPSSRTLRIEGREPVRHDVKVSRGASLGGALSGFLPEEVGQIRIIATSGQESRVGQLISDGGPYRIEHLLPGRWIVSVETEAGYRAQGEIVVAEGDRELALDLELTESKRPSGNAN